VLTNVDEILDFQPSAQNRYHIFDCKLGGIFSMSRKLRKSIKCQDFVVIFLRVISLK
jgi:hypothetical protein